MIIDRQENIALFTQESLSFRTFVERFRENYDKHKKDNIILNLQEISNLTANDLTEFFEVSEDHRKGNKSFVIVTNAVNYDDVHDNMVVVPTLKEAYDLIEMEDIERDLDA
ncbi:ribonuclease Z [Robertkochia aurantiaca]|uniref:ribonuclease Z n=1 Tax=Robertkochia aurantiaca TaxID=2873700 RepID=UPI001CCCD21B|nr:ribonuclease Z [Robertkochia sp. 3YJGBD-33]